MRSSTACLNELPPSSLRVALARNQGVVRSGFLSFCAFIALAAQAAIPRYPRLSRGRDRSLAGQSGMGAARCSRVKARSLLPPYRTARSTGVTARSSNLVRRPRKRQADRSALREPSLVASPVSSGRAPLSSRAMLTSGGHEIEVALRRSALPDHRGDGHHRKTPPRPPGDLCAPLAYRDRRRNIGTPLTKGLSRPPSGLALELQRSAPTRLESIP